MRRALNVAEKPSVAKQIAAVLADGKPIHRRPSPSKFNPISEFKCSINGLEYEMLFTSVRGHLMEVTFPPEYDNWLTTHPAALLTAPIKKQVPGENRDLEKLLVDLSQECTALVLWLDCDREGEAIAFEVLDICLKSNNCLKVSRAIFSAVTRHDVLCALATMRPPNPRLADAVEARQELDLRIGASLTRLMTLRFRREFEMPTKTISYGPCQFPTLGFIVTRYLNICSFKPEQFWTIVINIKCSDNLITPANNGNRTNILQFQWKRQRLFDKVAVLALYQRCLQTQACIVTKVQRKQIHRHKPLPLNTVAMTKLASRFYRYPAHQTMHLAESLYNKGLLSYPRTETDAYSSTIDLKSLVALHISHPSWGEYARSLCHEDGFTQPRRGSHNDEAHPPIHPVKAGRQEEIRDLNEWKLYVLICKHFLAECSADALGQQTIVEVTVGPELFTFHGVVILELNFLSIWQEFEPWREAIQVPLFSQGQQVDILSLLVECGQTKSPQLLSEVELITRMDKFGIGTDATMHEHIRTIQTRQYVERLTVGGVDRFKPTVLGLALYKGYRKCSRELTNPRMRAETEKCLTAIANGTAGKDQVIADEMLKYQSLVTKVGHNLGSMEEMLKAHFPTRARL